MSVALFRYDSVPCSDRVSEDHDPSEQGSLDVLRNSGAQATTCGHTLRFPRQAVRLHAGYIFNLRMEFFFLPSGISEMPSSPVSVALEADQSAFQHYKTGLAFLATTAVQATSL